MEPSTLDEKKVRYISLVRKEGGEPILGIPFREMSVDPDLVASFVLAVVIFEERQLRTFTKEGYVVLIEEGKYVVGLLIIDKVENEIPYRNELIGLIERFEKRFENQLENWRGDIRPFRAFGIDILGVFPYRRLDWTLVPRLVRASDATPDWRIPIPWSVGESDVKIQTVIGFINGKRTILEIMEATGFEEKDIIAIFSMLEKYKWITLLRRLDGDSILIKEIEPPRYLLGVYGDQLTRLVELCDGTRTLREVCNLLPYDIEAVKTVARNLVDAGILAHHDAQEREDMGNEH